MFYIAFAARRGGRGSPRCREGGGGGRFFFKLKSQEEGVSRRGRGRGAGRESAANWGICGGGGLIFFFFRGRNVHQVLVLHSGSLSLFQGQTQFVPGTNLGTKSGIKNLCVKS